MAVSSFDTEQVRLVSRSIFSGEKASLRGKKSVKKEIKANQSVFEPLVSSLGKEKTLNTICNLLERGAFASMTVAEDIVPAASSLSPELSIQANVPEHKPETTAMQEVGLALAEVEDAPCSDEGDNCVDDVWVMTEGQADDDLTPPADGKLTPRKTGALGLLELARTQELTQSLQVIRIEGDDTANVLSGNTSTSGLPPARLPIAIQYFLLTEVQRLLEECCYNFTRQWLPNIVKQRQFDSAVAVELNRWAFIIQKNMSHVPKEAFNLKIRNSTSILQSAVKLRHIAVHRHNLPIRELHGLVDAGASMASLLKQNDIASILRRVTNDLEINMSSLEASREMTKKAAAAKLEDIQRRREQLILEEKCVLAAVREQDLRSISVAGASTQKLVDLLRKHSLNGSDTGLDGSDSDEYYDSVDDFANLNI